MKICRCCGGAKADDYDPHLGEVCRPCGHLLEHVGLGLANHAGWRLCHPPAPRSASNEFPRPLGRINTEGPKS